MTRSQWLVFGGIAALMLFWMLGAHNRVVALRNAINMAWAPLDDMLQRREQALLALVDTLRPLLAAESGTLDAARAAQRQQRACLDHVRTRPSRADSVSGLGTAEAVLHTLKARVLALVDQDASLLAHGELAAQVRDLREIEPRLGFARQAFNEACKSYNSAVRQFPTRMLSPLLGFAEAGML
jgi:LemA protein